MTSHDASSSSNIPLPDALSHEIDELEDIQQRIQHQTATVHNERGEDAKEQPLDSSEVVELQAFVKHKEWIEDKIKVCRFAASLLGPLILLSSDSRAHAAVRRLRWCG